MSIETMYSLIGGADTYDLPQLGLLAGYLAQKSELEQWLDNPGFAREVCYYFLERLTGPGSTMSPKSIVVGFKMLLALCPDHSLLACKLLVDIATDKDHIHSLRKCGVVTAIFEGVTYLEGQGAPDLIAEIDRDLPVLVTKLITSPRLALSYAEVNEHSWADFRPHISRFDDAIMAWVRGRSGVDGPRRMASVRMLVDLLLIEWAKPQPARSAEYFDFPDHIVNRLAYARFGQMDTAQKLALIAGK